MAGTVSTAAEIRRLPQSVADAIAAGEVVERPASVVKELLENAIDSGASSLDVVVDGAGTVRIRVADDGAGIQPEQLPLALARHATSKIRLAADLEAVRTLGFRGEALASIAAIADVTIASRPRGASAGAQVRVRHGETVEEGSWGGPAGTLVEVLDLFAATPARLRFLRSDRAEIAAVLEVVSDVVLIHPDVRVTCTIDSRARLRSRGGSLDDALRCIFGPDSSEMLAVAAEGDINVGGAISEPRRHRGTRGGLVLVVNGRRVHNRSLLAAAGEAYRGLVPAGRHPFGVLSVEIEPLEVDVNVHPTKREVRFRDERGVFAAVQRACWRALQGASVYHAAWPLSGGAELGLADAGSAPDAPGGPGESVPTGAPGRTQPTDETGRAVAAGDAGRALAAGETGPIAQQAPANRTTLRGLGRLRALGQQEGRWLLATSAAGVVVVDPHAAHEKVLYSELIAQWRSGSSAGQLLLIPALVDCDARRMELFSVHGELIAACGFSVDAFGPTTLRCTAVPAGASAADPARLLGELLDSLGAGGPVTEQRHRAAALIACHAAVRFGDELAADEQQRLLDRLVEASGGFACPHGRPALAVFDDATLRRIFRRPAE
ncbi:MAG: DNA mismatch repair endonuclease MutL [Candidatus Dormibacteraeota bacterium]|uniref:DNA mismatch repair protein MutL n=1 Tax=Candidatus Amunia macphersoniae TaxID=3127014 RepID=A0A934KP98_9BACT|nr:DNA mismatch repair endonuclease MutL [Candidatus Dormibacteraeota bacterium]